MSREELVDAYVQGQISRRTFIRRLVGAGVTIAAAVTYADVLGASPAAADEVQPQAHDECDHYDEIVEVRGSKYTPRLVTAPLGGTIKWLWLHNNREVVSNLELFNSGSRDEGAHFCVDFKWAGVHRYRNRIGESFRGKVEVLPKISPNHPTVGDEVKIKWGTENAPPGFGWDVERKGPEDDDWVRIRDFASNNQMTPNLNDVGLWRFRVRLRRKTPFGVTGWARASVQVDP